MSPEETAFSKRLLRIVTLCILLKPMGRCCEAIAMAELAFLAAQQSPDALGDWERCVRVQAALSVKLRLAR